MRNVTISMDEDLHQKVRVDAAKAGMSVSRYVSEVLKSVDASAAEETKQARVKAQVAALERLWATPMWDVSENGRMPNADERNARR
jgi:plasmid stability protein